MGKLGARWRGITGIALLFQFTGGASALAENTSALWKIDPVGAAAYSDVTEEDRTGRGMPDLWREFYSDGTTLHFLKFDSTGKRGRPDIVYEFSPTGQVISVREDRASDGRPQTFLEFLVDGAGHRYSRLSRSPDKSGRFTVQETRTLLPDGGSRTETRENGQVYVRYDDIGVRSAVIDNAYSSCLRANPGGFIPTDDVNRVLGSFADRIQVQPDCNNGMGSGSTQDSVKSKTADLLNQGLRCLKQLGGQGAKMADGLIANVLTPAGSPPNTRKPLTVGCQLPEGTEHSSSGDTAAVSEEFDDCDYPAVYFNQKGMTPRYSDQTMFHEMLHESGIEGHECLHEYGHAESEELVEPCAACCIPENSTPSADQGSATWIKNTSCALCRGDYKNNPAQHALLYAQTQIKKGYYQIAAQELRKSVMYDPNNKTAWTYLALALSKLAPSPQRDQRILAALEQTIRLTPNAADQQRIRQGDLYQDVVGRLFTGDATTNPILAKYFHGQRPSDDMIAKAVPFFAGKALAMMTLESCGSIHTYTDGQSGPTAPVTYDWGGQNGAPPNCGKAFVMAYRSMYNPVNTLYNNMPAPAASPAPGSPPPAIQPFRDDMAFLQDTYQQMATGKSYFDIWESRNHAQIEQCVHDNAGRADPRPNTSPVARPGCPAPQRQSFEDFVRSGCRNVKRKNDPFYSSYP